VPKVTFIDVRTEMALLASVILRCSVKADAAAQIPSESQLLEKMVRHRNEWLAILERIRPVADDAVSS
jgi:hypothetical protein